MSKITLLLVSVLILSACSDPLEQKNQAAIEVLQSEVTTLKNQVVALEQNRVENEKPLSNIYIAPPEFKSELDARLASFTTEKGIELVEVLVNESGGTDLTLFSQDGSAFKRIPSKKDFSSELKPYNGYVRERIPLLITADPEDDQAILLKKIILSILEEKEPA